MSCSAYLLGSLIKTKVGVRLFQISQPSTLGGNLNAVPFLAPLKNRPSFPLQFGQEENVSDHSIERRAY